MDPAAARVSFSVNVCNSDLPFVGPTLRHMLPALGHPFCERRVAYDPGRQEGKYATRMQGDRAGIEKVLDKLLAEKVIDYVDVIPWTADDQRRILAHYFGSDNVQLKDFSGAPIYQYLYALDCCSGDFVFHADSDMLFHRRPGAGSWIAEGVALMRHEPRVIITCPRAGPPQAVSWVEKLVGRSFEKLPTQPWRRVDFSSTRYFLIDRNKLQACLPLEQAKPGEPLENSLTHTIKLRGYEQWNLTTLDHWTIHPWAHDENYVRHLPDLIWAVENGVYPLRRGGFRWDLRTDGRHIEPWLRMLRRHGRATN